LFTFDTSVFKQHTNGDHHREKNPRDNVDRRNLVLKFGGLRLVVIMQCWNYTFFEELVQACEIFWEKYQNSTAAYLVHSSGA